MGRFDVGTEVEEKEFVDRQGQSAKSDPESEVDEGRLYAGRYVLA